jgi:GH25 family lysozyme M1 (1,4-beta-N-acetylmuramidase)
VFYLEPHGCIGREDLAEHPLWLANFPVPTPAEIPDENDLPDTPDAWTRITIWQYAEDGVVDGVPNPCDVDAFNGDSIDDLKKLGKPPSEPE